MSWNFGLPNPDDDDDVDDKVISLIGATPRVVIATGFSERIQDTIDRLLQSGSRVTTQRLRRVAPIFDRIYRVRATCTTLDESISSVLQRLANDKQTAESERVIAHIGARLFRTCDLSIDEVIVVVQRTVRCAHQYATSCAFLALIQLGFSSHIEAFLDSPAGTAYKAFYSTAKPLSASTDDFVTRSKLGLAGATILTAIRSGMFATTMHLLRMEWFRETITLANLQPINKAIADAIGSAMVASTTKLNSAVIFESQELATSASNSLFVEDSMAIALTRLETWIQQNTRPTADDRPLIEAGRIRFDIAQLSERAKTAAQVHSSVSGLFIERLLAKLCRDLESKEAKDEVEAKIQELQARIDACDALENAAPSDISADAVAEKTLGVLTGIEEHLYRYRLLMAAEHSLLEQRLHALEKNRIGNILDTAEQHIADVRASISELSEADYFPS